MVKFSGFLEKKWDISSKIAKEICGCFDKGDSIYYVCDYKPSISAEVSLSLLSDVYDYLQEIKDLYPKKKRIINALKKADVLDKNMEERINLNTCSTELDDILLPYRPNARGRGQVALKKGLGALADIVNEQEVEEGSLEELAEEYVGKDKTLKTVEDVINGVRDILVERYAADETTRAMVRDYGYEDGFFEVTPKAKKDKKFIKYRGKMIPVSELTPEEYALLCEADEKKDIRFKHGVQLFHISELLRHHFIENPDAIGFDIICEAIDECWSRLLQSLVEKDVKSRLYKKTEDWAIQNIEKELKGIIENKKNLSSILVVGKFNDKNLIITGISAEGHLLGAASDTLHGTDADSTSNRLKQFFNRYRPSRVIVYDNEFCEATEAIAQRSLKSVTDISIIERYKSEKDLSGLLKSEWMQKRCAVLEDTMKITYALGLVCLQPLSLISEIGINFFNIHPMQKFIKTDRLERMLNRKITEIELRKGISYLDCAESILKNIPCVSEEILVAIRKEGGKKAFASKSDVLKVEGMTEIIFRNIAGYIVIPKGKTLLDRSCAHPNKFEWISDISREFNMSMESIIKNPDIIRSLQCEEFSDKYFIDQKLPDQLRIAQKYPMISSGVKHQRRSRLSELKEGAIISGSVTNITKFGVFVDINAVCDGLVHISQLADSYVETAEQVVHPNDSVDVRILAIDKKKRRVSLSMKKMGSKAPKVRPSEGQLTNLADHFKNR